MKKTKDSLGGPEFADLIRLWLLDLYYQLRPVVNFFGGFDNLGSCRFILGVAETAGKTGRFLYNNRVVIVGLKFFPNGQHTHPTHNIFGVFWYAYNHLNLFIG